MVEHDDSRKEKILGFERAIFIYTNAAVEAEIMPGEQPLRNVKTHYQTAENKAKELGLNGAELAEFLAEGFGRVAENLREKRPIATLIAQQKSDLWTSYREKLKGVNN